MKLSCAQAVEAACHNCKAKHRKQEGRIGRDRFLDRTRAVRCQAILSKSGLAANDPIADFTLNAHAMHMSTAPMARIRVWARGIKRDVIALWLAARDPRVPWYAKALAAVIAAYALSPIDLIPDFIPVLGYLDDLLIVPLGILVAVKFIPDGIMADLRKMALEQRRPTSKAGLVVVLTIWLGAMVIAVRLMCSRI